MEDKFKISDNLYLGKMDEWPDEYEFNLLKGAIENFIDEYLERVSHINEYLEHISHFDDFSPLLDGFYEINTNKLIVTDKLKKWLSSKEKKIYEDEYFLSIYDLLREGEKLAEIIEHYYRYCTPQSAKNQKVFARFLSSYHSLWFLTHLNEFDEDEYFRPSYICSIGYWYRKLKENLSSIDNTVFKFIHPTIKRASTSLFKAGFYRHAVLDSFIEVINKVKEVSSASEDLDGADLINQAFSGKNSDKNSSKDGDKKETKKIKQVLKFNNLSSKSEKNEQDGIKHLFQGIVCLRNKDAHLVTFQQNDNHALGYILLSSLLMYLLDDVEDKKGSTKRRTKQKPDKRIKSMIEKFDIAMKGIDPEIEIKQKKHYKAYARLKNIFCLVPFAKKITLYTNLFSVQELSNNFTVRDVSDIGHHGTGNTEITIETVKGLEKFIEEIRKKYEKEDKKEDNSEVTIETVKRLERLIEEIRKKYEKGDNPEVVK